MIRTIGWLLLALGLSPTYTSAQQDQRSRILWSVDWSFDDQYFAVGGERSLLIFDSKTKKRIAWRVPVVSQVATAVKWNPKRRQLAVAGDRRVTGIYDIDTGNKTVLSTDEGARGISWNSSGNLVATAGNDGSAQIWQSDGTLVHTNRPEAGKSLTAIAWHPTEDIFVSVGEFITIHESAGNITKQIRHRPNAKGFCLLLCIEWHPSGEFFVVGDYGNEDFAEPPALQFWSADGHLLRAIVQEEGAEFRNIHWNQDGSLLASASDALRLWTTDGKLQNTGDFSELLWGVRWNHAGDKLLTSSIGGDLTLWNSDAGNSLEILPFGNKK